MAETVTDFGTGTTYEMFSSEVTETAAENHVHDDGGGDDHSHDAITSFDVTTGSANTLAVNTLNATDLEAAGATIADLTVYDTMNANDVNVSGSLDVATVNTTNLGAEIVLSEDIEAITTDTHTLKIGHNLYYRDVAYEVSDKFHKVGNQATTEDETETTAPTLVVRDRATGCRITNLSVRSDNSAGYTGTFPGLFFDQGTCSTKFSLVDDGQAEYMQVDAQGNPISGEYTRMGWLSSGVHGLDVSRAGDGQTLVRGGTVQIQAGTGQSDATPSTCFAITAEASQSDLQLIVDSRGTQHFYRSGLDSDVPILAMRELDGTLRSHRVRWSTLPTALTTPRTQMRGPRRRRASTR